jgi:fumarate reductase flavoprotein subunit
MQYDVIVVGGGGAGLSAAISAAEAGARTLLLEKAPALGGSTGWAIGSVTATRTPHQYKAGIEDDPAWHHEDMTGFEGDRAGRDNLELRRVLCDEMPATFQWLLDSGVRFFGPMPEPPHRHPRMHNVLPNSRSFIHHLGQRARRAGVEIRTGTPVTNLVVEQSEVRGVGVDGAEIRARGGVILAAGDFTASAELKARFMGPLAAQVEPVNVYATGDGQRMAEALGARIVNGDLALGPEIRFIAPTREHWLRRLPPWPVLAAVMQWSMAHLPPWLLRPFMMKFLTTVLAPSPQLFADGAVLVNARGERFGDETDRPATRLPSQPGNRGWILLDARLAARYEGWPNFISTAPGIAYAYLADYRRNRPDVFTEAPTLADLARRLGMDAAALTASAAARGLGHGPFIALGPVRSLFVHNEGGLAVDTEHRVLGRGDRPIPGLWASGSTGQGGLLLRGHGHHLGWAFASGRRAGRFAAAAAAAARSRRADS